MVSAYPGVRDQLRGLSTMVLIRHCAAMSAVAPADSRSAAIYTLRLLAGRIDQLAQEIADLDAR